jgi:hypothetical protein
MTLCHEPGTAGHCANLGPDTHDRRRMPVSGHQHRPGMNTGRIPGIAQHRPSKPFVIFGIEVGYQHRIDRG